MATDRLRRWGRRGIPPEWRLRASLARRWLRDASSRRHFATRRDDPASYEHTWSSYARGTERIADEGRPGLLVWTRRVMTRGGQAISEEDLGPTVYAPLPRVIERAGW